MLLVYNPWICPNLETATLAQYQQSSTSEFLEMNAAKIVGLTALQFSISRSLLTVLSRGAVPKEPISRKKVIFRAFRGG